jgi:hypothetical protein
MAPSRQATTSGRSRKPSLITYRGDMLVVTSASFELDESERAARPHAGATFTFRTGVFGPAAQPWFGR